MRGRINKLAASSLFLVTLVSSVFATFHSDDTSNMDRLPVVGDQPDVTPPPATDLSPELKPRSVEKAISKVADWELNRVRGKYNTDWTLGVLYAGFMAASGATGDKKYRDAMKDMGNALKWRLGDRFNWGDDQVVGQTYIELYLLERDPVMIADAKAQLDRALKTPDGLEPLYWQVDLLFMAPPLWARMYKATGDRAYLDFAARQWCRTSDRLYDLDEHLFSRDDNYIDKKEANGKKEFWSRGNGWAFAGLVRVLQYMPSDYPDRPRFLQQFKAIAAKLASLQGADGLWRPGLLDARAYPLPETSGSAFYVYGLAWGVNEGILDRRSFEPAIAKAWKGLIGHIYSDGRFGGTQPVGEAPDRYKPAASYTFGVGAFLLAGSEVDRLAGSEPQALSYK